MTSVAKLNTPVRPFIQFSHLTSESLYSSLMWHNLRKLELPRIPQDSIPPVSVGRSKRLHHHWKRLSWIATMLQFTHNWSSHVQDCTLPPNKAWIAPTGVWRTEVKKLRWSSWSLSQNMAETWSKLVHRLNFWKWNNIQQFGRTVLLGIILGDLPITTSSSIPTASRWRVKGLSFRHTVPETTLGQGCQGLDR